jgi:tetratricopeptide (TPR) repeat protein
MRTPPSKRCSLVLPLFSVVSLVTCALGPAGCHGKVERLDPRNQTHGELRAVRRGVHVAPPGESERTPYARERLADGAQVSIDPGGLAWLRRDGGATVLVAGPAHFKFRSGPLDVTDGRLFVDTLAGAVAEVDTPGGPLQLSGVRASLDVSKESTSAYVLTGAVKTTGGVEAGPGEGLRIAGGKAEKNPVLSWEDWTGGLATTDRSAAPAPFGVGTVGARAPRASGQARFPLAIQKLETRVTIDHDLAITEVDEVFFNPSAETVEGIYRFRTPTGATLHRFGVDRDGELVWGRVKEKAAAAAQYASNVYEGSTEDPALLEWDAPGVYQARLYPIAPGGSRRVVTRYAEWLGRQGEHGERRLYVYPMAAEGAEASLPRIEELTVRIDMTASGAKDIRVGMHGELSGNRLVVRGHDLIPRADLAVELFDDGVPAGAQVAYRARHRVDPELYASEDVERATKQGKTEADYVVVPVRPTKANEPPGGLDVAVVVDTSAATEPSALAIARAATLALLAHLGKDDRVAVWASDAGLRPVSEGSGDLKPLDEARRDAMSAGLAKVERGGATDLGAVLADAAARLDPKRRGVVVYLGDGRPTVGELAVTDLRERLGRLPSPARLFAMGIGEGANMAVLKGVARGGFAERVVDGYGAGQAALRLLEEAERPVWLGVKVDLGVGVDRVYPREMGAVFADETALVVGRLNGSEPRQLDVQGSGGTQTLAVSTVTIADDGDMKRRWADGRLGQLLEEAAGRAAVVEVGVRYGVITPFTSYYVPTARERAAERARDGESTIVASVTSHDQDDKQGGTGTRAKGEEGSMGNPKSAPAARYAVKGPADNAQPMKEAAEFGMIGLLNSGAGGAAPPSAAAVAPTATATPMAPGATRAAVATTSPSAAADPNQPTAPWGRDDSGNKWGDAIVGAGGLGLSGTGEGGGGQPNGLANVGTIGRGAGFGNGHGRLGGEHHVRDHESENSLADGTKDVGFQAPLLRQGPVQVNGRLPPEVIQRIVRQNFGRFRLCYENGLRKNASLQGRVSVKFGIDRSGAVSMAADGGSDLPDPGVIACVTRGFSNLSFPAPEGGLVTVTYPIVFSPGDGGVASMSPSASRPAGTVLGITGLIGFVVRLCDRSSELPLEERVLLWRERLGGAGQDVSRIAGTYQDALSRCEAPTWGERTRLLGLMLDTLPSVRARVELWRAMFSNTPVADILYRGLLARVHTTDQLRELHDALGLRRIDPALVATTLAKEKTPADRAAKLQELVQVWPDDLELALRLLDAYEDARDAAGERALARQLRRRPDANTKVRTQVGEVYLRLAKAAKAQGGDPGDEAEARRTFGEIVEFAPDDPVARRRLGDLLRSHGWYDEAFRQYETLAKLTPDDAGVSLLLAGAAAGMGKIEEAVGWAEKAGASAAPDGSELGMVARDWASVYLAWARAEAKAAGRDKEVTALRERAGKLASASSPAGTPVRVFLTWTHPEVRPALWSNATGSPAPTAAGDALLGIAVVTIPASRKGPYVEVHFDDEDAQRALRLGAEVTLTAIYDEAAEDEQITRLPIHLTTPTPVRRFRVDRATLTEEAVR